MSISWVCARPRPDSKLSSGWKQNPKPTRNACRIGRFKSRRVFGFTSWFRFLSLMPLFWPNPSRSSRYLAKSVEIWPNHNKISPNLIGFGLDLNKISSNLIRSNGFQVNFRQITSNIAGFCMFSSKNLQISPKVSRFMIGSGCSSLGEENCQPTQRCRVLWAASRH